jgi:hypothetical protein
MFAETSVDQQVRVDPCRPAWQLLTNLVVLFLLSIASILLNNTSPAAVLMYRFSAIVCAFQ